MVRSSSSSTHSSAWCGISRFPAPVVTMGMPAHALQEGAVGSAWDPVVARLLAGQMLVGPRHRPDQRLVFRGLGRRALFDHLQRRVEVGVFRISLARISSRRSTRSLVGLGRHRADVQGDVGARGDDVDLGLPAVGAHEDGRREARIAEERVLAVALDLLPSSSSTATTNRAALVTGLTPLRGMAPCAIVPRTVTSTLSAPFCFMQSWFSSGSQITAASTPSACPRSMKALIPAIIPSSSTG